MAEGLRRQCRDDGTECEGVAGALRPLFPEWADGLPSLPEPLQDAKAEARGDDPTVVAKRFREVATTWQRLPRPFDAALAREREAPRALP